MIKLIHDYVIDVSDKNYTLMLDKHKQDKKGNAVYETLGFYGRLNGAIQSAKEYCIRRQLTEGIYTLDEALKIIKATSEEFSDLLTKAVIK